MSSAKSEPTAARPPALEGLRFPLAGHRQELLEHAFIDKLDLSIQIEKLDWDLPIEPARLEPPDRTSMDSAASAESMLFL
ncbi:MULTISPECIES: hypothetical protein [unclassified Paenibacillus]|uniref:hypothetical protein n=1 Tax=unclassified Paenibacillus TaxID=185978 RepID=UPI0011158E29|nr:MULTISPECIES: hypothetical protein [unclassified Paenibacillus]QID16079.1 hypothetical protein CIC07_25470 [Paenibacillus sp. RUD330]